MDTTTTTTTDNDKPRRCIFNDDDMKHFMESSTKKDLLNFVEAMGKSLVAGGDAPFDPENPLVGLTPSMASLHGSLRQMVTWVDDFPPTGREVARFGNPAFRLWHGRLLERSCDIVTAIIEARDSGEGSNRSLEEASQIGWDAAAGKLERKDDDPNMIQVSCYLHDSFGHATRLDYGTGHESSFVVFLLVLSKLACFGKTPSLPMLRAVTLSIFNQYLILTRRLQTDYLLEPAGSHGVWGLDDYHCLPFYFGACQMQASGVSPHELQSPKCILDETLLRDYGDSYLYLSCIRYIRQLKKGVPFFESSPMLHDISQLETWAKVARGLLRLYQGEVLDKRQVVQHFLFAKLFPATWTPSQTERTAPSINFRVPDVNGIPMGRAPWASNNNDPSMSPTRAPWADGNNGNNQAVVPTQATGANNSNNQGGLPPPTKAPWAK